MRIAAAAMAFFSVASAAQSLPDPCGRVAPSARISVVFAPASAQIDETKAAKDIELDDRKTRAFRHLGVTRATLLRDVDVRLNGYTDEGSGRACAWPSIEVKLSVRPLLIELAHELGADQCLREHVLEHELRHVAIYNAHAASAAARLQSEMQQAYGSALLIGDAARMLNDLREEIAQRWLRRLDELIGEADAEHDALDVAEERDSYSVCNGALSKLMPNL
jgi:hypothetical protein